MNMVDDKITLDKKSFEALAADSRVSILKSLAERQKTLTELAAQFHLSPSTVKEHMQVLEGAGLVVMKDEGRKWKYYELTWKGKNIVQPRELKIWIVLGLSAVILVGALFMLVSKLPGQQLPFGIPDSRDLSNLQMPAVSIKPGEGGAPVGAPSSAGIVGGDGIVAVGMPSLEFGTGPVLTPRVKGCAETGQETAGKASGQLGEVEIPAEVIFEGNILTYSRAIRHACCLQVQLAKELGGEEIRITEEWTGEPCKCMCFSEVGATLENLPAGKYAVSVYEAGSIVPDGQERLVISKEVEVG